MMMIMSLVGCPRGRPGGLPGQAFFWVALLVQRYLPNAASFVFYGTTCLTYG